MPAMGILLAPSAELLTFEEIVRVVRVGAKLGLSKIRLTGGEPTERLQDLELRGQTGSPMRGFPVHNEQPRHGSTRRLSRSLRNLP